MALKLTTSQLQVIVFRLTSIASDIIRLAKSVATPRLIMLDVMPNELDRAKQQIIVSACSVLLAIYKELRMRHNTDPVVQQMYGTMVESYKKFNKFLRIEYISLRFNLYYVNRNHMSSRGHFYSHCYHGDDWISRITCDTFAPAEIHHSDRRFDSADWLAFVRQINNQTRHKFEIYMKRFFLRSYFAVALGCSSHVVEAVDVALFHLSGF